MLNIFNCSDHWGRFNIFSFNPKSGNTITQRNGANNFLHESFVSRDSNDIEKSPKLISKSRKTGFTFLNFSLALETKGSEQVYYREPENLTLLRFS